MADALSKKLKDILQGFDKAVFVHTVLLVVLISAIVKYAQPGIVGEQVFEKMSPIYLGVGCTLLTISVLSFSFMMFTFQALSSKVPDGVMREVVRSSRLAIDFFLCAGLSLLIIGLSVFTIFGGCMILQIGLLLFLSVYVLVVQFLNFQSSIQLTSINRVMRVVRLSKKLEFQKVGYCTSIALDATERGEPEEVRVALQELHSIHFSLAKNEFVVNERRCGRNYFDIARSTLNVEDSIESTLCAYDIFFNTLKWHGNMQLSLHWVRSFVNICAIYFDPKLSGEVLAFSDSRKNLCNMPVPEELYIRRRIDLSELFIGELPRFAHMVSQAGNEKMYVMFLDILTERLRYLTESQQYSLAWKVISQIRFFDNEKWPHQKDAFLKYLGLFQSLKIAVLCHSKELNHIDSYMSKCEDICTKLLSERVDWSTMNLAVTLLSPYDGTFSGIVRRVDDNKFVHNLRTFVLWESGFLRKMMYEEYCRRGRNLWLLTAVVDYVLDSLHLSDETLDCMTEHHLIPYRIKSILSFTEPSEELGYLLENGYLRMLFNAASKRYERLDIQSYVCELMVNLMCDVMLSNSCQEKHREHVMVTCALLMVHEPQLHIDQMVISNLRGLASFKYNSNIEKMCREKDRPEVIYIARDNMFLKKDHALFSVDVCTAYSKVVSDAYQVSVS